MKRKIGAKLAIALATMSTLGAVLAGSAFAGTAVTDPAAWVKTESGVAHTITSENINCGVTSGATFTLEAKVLKSPLKLTATGFNCTGAKISTTGSGSSSMAGAEGQIEFTGVTVDEPSGCRTPSTSKTNAVVADLQMDEAAPTKSYLKFTPAAGSTANFTTVKLEGCAAAGNYPLKGAFFIEATDPTGSHTEKQEVAGNETTIAMSTLRFGSEPVTLTGEFYVELASHALWGAEEP